MAQPESTEHTGSTTGRLPGLSVVCVWNDPVVRARCLDSSLAAELARADDLELIAVDNVDQVFTSAGAALDHGARQARHEVVVFVHQDVHLHSVQRLRELATHLRGDTWGVIGACGITHDGTLVGQLRDRVQLIGESTSEPRAVDSVDEVLFMVRRDRVLAHPLSQHPDLAWHAYAVELGLRLRNAGLATGAADAAITHHSLTVNLARLDAAHARVAALHPAHLPVRTTCGIVGGGPASTLRRVPGLRSQTWRPRWLVESGRALAAGHRQTSQPTVLVDVRQEVDDLAWSSDRPLRVVNVDHEGHFADLDSTALTLPRLGREVRLESVRSAAEAAAMLGTGTREDSWLVTNLTGPEVREVAAAATASGAATLLGVHEHDLWLLVGLAATRPPAAWSRPRAVPLLAGV